MLYVGGVAAVELVFLYHLPLLVISAIIAHLSVLFIVTLDVEEVPFAKYASLLVDVKLVVYPVKEAGKSEVLA